MSGNKSSRPNVFISLLAVAFIVLKLCGVITWSWWWVLCPLWAGIALVIAGFLLYLLATAIKQAAKENSRKNDKIKYPVESQWEKRVREMQERHIEIEIKKQRAKIN